MDREIIGVIRAVQRIDVASLSTRTLNELAQAVNNINPAALEIRTFLDQAREFLDESNLDELKKIGRLEGVQQQKFLPILSQVSRNLIFRQTDQAIASHFDGVV